MKRALTLLLILLLSLTGLAAHAEPAEALDALVEAARNNAYNPDELTVGSVTPFSGNFFSPLWGNVTSDLDVRMLVHGYNPVEWRSDEGAFAIDPSVVSGLLVTDNAAGDRTYTLTLYDDLRYCDGTPITARDYAFSILLSVAPEVAEIGGKVRPVQYLLGYGDYASGRAKALAGVRILREDTLAITVSSEYLPFFYELALLDFTPFPIGVIAPGCVVADDGSGAYIANADPNAQEPVFTADLLRKTLLDPETGYLSHPSVSSGPYRLLSYDGETVELERNPYYKGDSSGRVPAIERLHVRTVRNETMIRELANGQVDLLNKCANAEALDLGTRLAARSGVFACTDYARSGLSFISFCCEQTPMDSLSVRKAIALCMDKDGLVRDTVGSYGRRVDGYYGIGQWMYRLVSGAQPLLPEQPAAAWESVTLKDVPAYDLDVAAASALLAREGWTLNREGEAYVPGKDDVRCRRAEDGTLQPLELKLLYPDGSSVGPALEANFTAHLAEAGIRLSVECVPMQQLLPLYYRQQPRDCHMIAMATNFDVVYDPAPAFMPDGDAVNPYNATAIADRTLYELAADMRHTEPGDLLVYCRKWVAFQQRFAALLPALPLYSNLYCDFYPGALRGYDIAGNISWSRAILGASLVGGEA